jgi:hypothetical protein
MRAFAPPQSRTAAKLGVLDFALDDRANAACIAKICLHSAYMVSEKAKGSHRYRMQALEYLVAGTGFEPVTFGL